MTPEIEEFAQVLIKWVRDAAIQSSEIIIHPDANDPAAKRWRLAAHDGTLATFAHVVIPDVVDETLFYLLRAIDEELLTLSFTASNGKAVNLTTEGLSELAGWYIGSGGWRAMYSKERFVDDFADLAGGDSSTTH